MSKSRNIIKRVVYKTLGENSYRKAYVHGKIKDIKNGTNLEEEAKFLKYFVSEDSTVLDIGANYGHYTSELSKLASKGKVYAFEPIPFTFDVLKNIVTHFKLNQVSLYHNAVSDKEGEIDMSVPTLDFGAPNTGVAHVTVISDSKSIRVKTIRLDELQIDGRIDFIKIDIEGHEPVAFKGMENLIATNRPVILIEFSHSCLVRAGFIPGDFGDYLSQNLNYNFTQIQGDKLKLSGNANPVDGYYFLLPKEKLSTYSEILTS